MRIPPLIVGMALATVSFACAEDLPFTPSQISRLIDSGVAPGRGAGFATPRYGSGIVSSTHLWQESADHHVFFITRNGVSYGEYREQTLAEGMRLADVEEYYLVAEARTAEYLREATTLPFIRRKTTPDWQSKATAKLKDGRCSIWINCPTDARNLVFDLYEVGPPQDPGNALLTEKRDVGSMTASIDSLKDELVFKPD